jgi:uncharacterized protein involved in exopolysaccharide biosynthesis
MDAWSQAGDEYRARRDDGEERKMKRTRRPAAPEPAVSSTLGRTVGYWWVILLAILVGVGSTAWFARGQPPLFRANATLVLAPVEGLGDTRQVTDALNTLDRRSVVATLAMVPSSRAVRDRARAELGLTNAQIRPYQVKTAVVPDSNIIEVTVEGPNPQFAAAFAYAIAEQSISSTPEFYNIYAMKVLDWPVVPSHEAGPGLVRKLLVGGLSGLLVGIGAAMLLAYASAHRYRPRFGQAVRALVHPLRRKNRPARVIKGVHVPDIPDPADGEAGEASN